jgi:hypothetical protein
MLRILLCFFAFSLLGGGFAEAAGECPVEVRADPANPVAYKNRGDRCEGVFRQQVAASAQLSLIGVHRHAPDFKARSGKDLKIASPPHLQSGTALSLRILSSRPRQYYRLDANLTSGAAFLWKRDVIDNSALQLGPNDIKALLCDKSCSVREPKIYPVSIVEDKAPRSEGVSFWFRAAVDLKAIFVSISPAPGQKGSGVEENDILEGRTLPAGAPASVFAPLKPGTYVLKATAVPLEAVAIDEIRAKIVAP